MGGGDLIFFPGWLVGLTIPNLRETMNQLGTALSCTGEMGTHLTSYLKPLSLLGLGCPLLHLSHMTKLLICPTELHSWPSLLSPPVQVARWALMRQNFMRVVGPLKVNWFDE